MTFRQKRNYGISAARQGYIYFTCQRYSELSENQREYIRSLCREASKDDENNYKALLDTVTNSYPMQKSAMRYYMDISSLSRLVRKFYKLWRFDDKTA